MIFQTVEGTISFSNPGNGQWSMRLNDKDVNGKELTYAVFTVSDFCVQITSGLDQNLCGSGAENWAGGELKVIKQIKTII